MTNAEIIARAEQVIIPTYGRYPVAFVRGQGAMLRREYLINCTVERVLRFLPPLTITEQEVDGLLTVLDTVLGEELV